MPKLVFARAPQEHEEEYRIRKLARSRHAPSHWLLRSRIIIASWQDQRTTAIAAALNCHSFLISAVSMGERRREQIDLLAHGPR